MPKVPESDHLPSQVMQKRWYTCLAANLAAILHSYGIKTKQWKDERGLPAMRDVDDILVTELYYCLSNSFERYEAFNVLPELTALMPPTRTINAQKDVKSSFEEWWTTVANHIRRESYVLISYKTEGGSHIVTAYQVENDILCVYNPARMPTKETLGKNRLDEMWKQQELNHDILVVSKVSQQEVGEVSLVDKDIEIFRLQTAAAHYEASVETGINTFLAFLVGITIFLLGVMLELTRLGYAWYVTLFMAAAIYLVCSLSLYLYPMRKYIREYNSNMQKLDRYAQDVAAGKTAPSLKELCS